MATLIFWLIAAGSYSIYFVVKSLKSTHDDVKGTPIGGEVFPPIKMYTPDTNTYEEYIEAPDTKAKPKSATTKSKTEEKSNKAASVTPPADIENEEGSKISLKNRSEAKRAFIHAEIFNRKYN